MTVAGIGLRVAADSSAATSPRSSRMGGANPRDSERNSSRASFDCCIASAMSARAFSGSASSWRSAAARSICMPHQALLRPVVDVTLEAAQRVTLGGTRRTPGVAQVAHCLPQRLRLPGAEHAVGDTPVHGRQPTGDERQGRQEQQRQARDRDMLSAAGRPGWRETIPRPDNSHCET